MRICADLQTHALWCPTGMATKSARIFVFRWASPVAFAVFFCCIIYILFGHSPELADAEVPLVALLVLLIPQRVSSTGDQAASPRSPPTRSSWCPRRENPMLWFRSQKGRGQFCWSTRTPLSGTRTCNWDLSLSTPHLGLPNMVLFWLQARPGLLG